MYQRLTCYTTSHILQHHFTITPTKGSPLTICFSDAPKAQQWHRLTKEAATNARLEAPTQSKKARRWSKLGVEGGSHSRKASLVDDSMGMGSDDGTVCAAEPLLRDRCTWGGHIRIEMHFEKPLEGMCLSTGINET